MSRPRRSKPRRASAKTQGPNRLGSVALLLVFSALAAATGLAQPSTLTADAPAQEEIERQGPTDAAGLEAFVDGWMAAYLDAENVAGATISVVRDGSLLFVKGYGFADVETRAPVSPERTLFRIGSVTKLFVWISVMQQVEAGMLDLDTDVNEYLTDLEVPGSFDGPAAGAGPITLRHLMTHTPGFEDQVLGLFGRDESTLKPLVEILRAEMPARVRAAGDLASYSNHGTALAMHVVEQVTGTEWLAYIKRHILEPLGQSRLSLDQPLPPALAADLSKGYRFAGGDFQEQPFEFVPLAPVGAGSASAVAMAQFMKMLLNDCEIDGKRVLEAETCSVMLSDLHRMDPGVNAMAHGFMDMSSHGQRVVGHGGDTLWFHTWLVILPEHELGVFLSFNTNTGNPAALYRAFLDHYFPEDEAGPEPAGGNKDQLERFTGSFRANRFSHNTLAKVAALVGALEITVDDKGYLVTRGVRKTRWAPDGPLRFKEVHGDREMVFREDANGRISHVLRSDLPILAFERPPASESPKLHQLLFVLGLVILLATVAWWPTTALIRRHYGVVRLEESRIPRGARWLLWLASLTLVVFAVGLAISLRDPNEVVYGVNAGIKALQVLPVLAGLLGLGALVSTIRIWLRGSGGLVGRLAYSISTLAVLVLLWQLNVWNLMGWRY